MNEEYRILEDIDPKYAISNLGNIKNIKTNRILKPEITNKGYYKVNLSINGVRKKFYIHRLVAMMFLINDDPEKKDNVNHKDGNKLNNHIDNLEWCSSSENQIHAIRTGLKPQCIPIIATNLETNEEMEFSSIKECAQTLGMFTNGIRRVLSHECTHHHGYTFRRI